MKNSNLNEKIDIKRISTFYQKNKEELLDEAKQYYENNKERLREQAKSK